jgi:hypothetical protein
LAAHVAVGEPLELAVEEAEEAVLRVGRAGADLLEHPRHRAGRKFARLPHAAPSAF